MCGGSKSSEGGGVVLIGGKLCVMRAVKNSFRSVGIMRSVYTALRPCAR